MLAAVIENALTGSTKGGLYENLVAGMQAKAGHELRCWMSQSGNREVEFLLDGSGLASVPASL